MPPPPRAPAGKERFAHSKVCALLCACLWHFLAYSFSLLAEALVNPYHIDLKPTNGSQPPSFQSRATKDAEKEGAGCWGGVTGW